MVSIAVIKKLNNDGWVLYYASWCMHCKNLKKKLGVVKWTLLNKVDCANSKSKCPSDIEGYPTWKNSVTGSKWNGSPIFR